MTTVNNIVSEIKQPKDGLLPIAVFEKKSFNDNNKIIKLDDEVENLCFLTVNYLTKFFLKRDINSAFEKCFLGAAFIGEESKAHQYASKISALDEQSIINASRLAEYEVCATTSIINYRYNNQKVFSYEYVQNVKIMVNRNLQFLSRYASKIMYDHSLEGGYSDIIDSGEIPFITYDSILMLSFKEDDPTNNERLEALLYYVMGIHSIYPTLLNVKFIVFFNPRTNTFYNLKASLIGNTAISFVEKDVLHYNDLHYSSSKSSINLKIEDALEYLGVSLKTFNRLVKNKLITIINNKVSKNELDKYLKNKRMLQRIIWILSLVTILAVVILVVVYLTTK